MMSPNDDKLERGKKEHLQLSLYKPDFDNMALMCGSCAHSRKVWALLV